ncbi:hypothetical protein DL93DRAFT_403050 [Clavulina sp. PMI_390]|nr:hypothetical protein DL93DRAFT_403050 [Clavulina sp. PMI_390]
MTSLHNLPVELIHDIHLCALNPQLVVASRWLRGILQGLSTQQRAIWLVACSEAKLGSSPEIFSYESALPLILNHSLRFPLCTAAVLECIPAIVHQQTSHCSECRPAAKQSPGSSRHSHSVGLPRWLFSNICICPPSSSLGVEESGPSSSSNSNKCTASAHPPPPHELEPISHRSNRIRTASEVLDILTTLRQLQCHFPCARSSPPSPPLSITSPKHNTLFSLFVGNNGGAALTLSVAFGAHKVVRALLAMGGDPSAKGGIAVRTAIRRKDLALVRMLVERNPAQTASDDDEAESTTSATNSPTSVKTASTLPRTSPKIRRDKGPAATKSTSKRRKLQDRVTITPELVAEAMRLDARDIVNYFVVEKGCSPDVRALGRTFFK